MSESTFQVVFRGEIQTGAALAQVKQNMAKLFSIDAAKIDAIFSGKSVVLKRNLDEAKAKHMQAVLARAGAIVTVLPEAVAASPVAEKPRAPAATPPMQVTAARPAVSGAYAWTLAPVGMNLLRITERRRPVAMQFDQLNFSLREQQGNLLDATEMAPPATAQVKVPAVELARVGDDLLRPDERKAPVPERAAPTWGIAPVGTTLGVDLAPVAVVVPDISHLQLRDN